MKRFLTYLFICVALCASRVVATDNGYVLWMFDESETDIVKGIDGSDIYVGDLTGRGGNAEGKSINSARIVMTDADGNKHWLSNKDGSGNAVSNMLTLPDDDDAWSAGPVFADISGFNLQDDASVSFMIELGYYSEDSGWITLAASESANLEELRESGHVFNVVTDMQTDREWYGGTYTVPEPSSAILLLIGGGLLTLRRRRGAV